MSARARAEDAIPTNAVRTKGTSPASNIWVGGEMTRERKGRGLVGGESDVWWMLICRGVEGSHVASGHIMSHHVTSYHITFFTCLITCNVIGASRTNSSQRNTTIVAATSTKAVVGAP